MGHSLCVWHKMLTYQADNCSKLCQSFSQIPTQPGAGEAPHHGPINTSNLKQRNLALEIVRVTEAAALAAGRWYGKVRMPKAAWTPCTETRQV